MFQILEENFVIMIFFSPLLPTLRFSFGSPTLSLGFFVNSISFSFNPDLENCIWILRDFTFLLSIHNSVPSITPVSLLCLSAEPFSMKVLCVQCRVFTVGLWYFTISYTCRLSHSLISSRCAAVYVSWRGQDCDISAFCSAVILLTNINLCLLSEAECLCCDTAGCYTSPPPLPRTYLPVFVAVKELLKCNPLT